MHKAWLSGRGGAVVNVASLSGIRPEPGIGMYGASKAMLMHLTKELAVELSPRVRVNAVAPAAMGFSVPFGALARLVKWMSIRVRV